MTITLKIKRLTETAQLPRYMTPGSAGMDLAYDGTETVTLWPGYRHMFPTGLALEIPPGFEGQIRPRSGLALKHGITVCNSPGTVDESFRGEVKVLLVNLGDRYETIKPGDRIAQLVIAPVATAEIVEVAELSTTERGAGGFGSTSR